MDQMLSHPADEISIRQLLEILFKGRAWIALFTALALTSGSILAFLVLPDKFQTTATIIANPITMSTPNESDGLVDDLTKLPNINVSTYLYQIVGNEVLNKVISQNNLKSSNNQPLSIQALKETITINNPKDTNIIEVTVTHESATQAARIANAVCSTFVEYINDNSRTSSEKAAENINKQLIIEAENLKTKSDALTVYRQNSQDIDLLKGEVNGIISQINSNTSRLNALESVIETDKKTLASLLKLYPNIKDQTNADYQLSFEFDQNTGENSVNLNPTTSHLSDSLAIIELNKIQNRLIYNDNSRSALTENNNILKDMLSIKQIELTQEEYQYDALNREFELAKATYNAYQQRHKEAILAAAADLGKTKIMITSEAYIPEQPKSPNKLNILLISLMLGLMIGSMFVFGRFYWLNSN